MPKMPKAPKIKNRHTAIGFFEILYILPALPTCLAEVFDEGGSLGKGRLSCLVPILAQSPERGAMRMQREAAGTEDCEGKLAFIRNVWSLLPL
jgi:hypothetical protein